MDRQSATEPVLCANTQKKFEEMPLHTEKVKNSQNKEYSRR
jgi:hypothetical protein